MSLLLEKKPDSEEIALLYKNDKIKNHIYYQDDSKEKKNLTKIRLNKDDETFFPAINDFETTQQTQKIYLCGESGCGKTTAIIAYIHNFNKKYPKSKILFFSSKNEDASIDNIPYVERVKIDDDILKNPYTLAEISAASRPSLCVFDDVEDFGNKKITKEIERLLNEIIRNGRSYGIYCAYTHHQPSDYHATRNLLYEATHVFTFPKRCAKNSYDYLYEKKLNLNKKAINTINNIKSQFVCIKKKIPKCIIADKYIIIL
jgi:GTPase SAR1 family protein